MQPAAMQPGSQATRQPAKWESMGKAKGKQKENKEKQRKAKKSKGKQRKTKENKGKQRKAFPERGGMWGCNRSEEHTV